jgi:HTH-type transcriptional regulator/antitoxin HigA
MDHLKLITTLEEHTEALARVIELMDADPAPGTKQSDELDVLALLIERFEKEQFPIDLPDPVEAIKFRMEQQDFRQKDLVPFIGSAPKVSEVLKGQRQLSLNMIRKLHEGLGIPYEVLIQDPVHKDVIDQDIDWVAFPLSDMRKRGYLEGFNGSLQELKEYASEWVGRLLKSVPGGFDLQPAMLRTTAHMRSNDKETDPYALWAWQVRVLQRAQEVQLPKRYEAGTVHIEWMRNLAQLSWSEKGPELAIEFLNRSGIHLIVEPHLPKTYLDGAVCVNDAGDPVVALTLRHDRLDTFWFTLMHELAHIALHIDGGARWFIDDLDASNCDEEEAEADALAQQALIPSEHLQHLKSHDPESVRHLAEKLNVATCIVAGRLRHEMGDHQMFGKLFRDKVRGVFGL